MLYTVSILEASRRVSAASTDSLPSPAGLTPPITHSSLPILFPASEAEVSLLLNSLPNKQCELDPIPTSLLKDCASVLVPVITKIINFSLSSGNFPLVFKHSLVTTLLKKTNLDKENSSPPSPLTFASFSPFSQPALPDHPPVSPFLDPRSPLTSRSPKEPYPLPHRVSGMTCHLNSAHFLYLHHHHSKS